MPYIRREAREPYAFLEETEFGGPGELNYAIAQLIKQYWKGFERVGYAEINEVIGVLECAKLELYRRIAAPYEDHKIYENGDVY